MSLMGKSFSGVKDQDVLLVIGPSGGGKRSRMAALHERHGFLAISKIGIGDLGELVGLHMGKNFSRRLLVEIQTPPVFHGVSG